MGSEKGECFLGELDLIKEWNGCREFEVDFSGALIKEWLPGLDKVCKKDKK